MEAASRVTTKGQITIPKAVREALGLVEGDAVVFRVEGNRAVLARTPDLLDSRAPCPCPLASGASPGTRCAGGHEPHGLVAPMTAFVDTTVSDPAPHR